MRHSNRNVRRRRRKQIAKSASIATMSLVSFSLVAGAAVDRSLFIFDDEVSRMPGLRFAQVKRGGARRGRRGMPGLRAMPGGRAGGLIPPDKKRMGAGGVAPLDKKRMGVGPASPGFLQSAPAVDSATKSPAKPPK
jgi:hypothetical protein